MGTPASSSPGWRRSRVTGPARWRVQASGGSGVREGHPLWGGGSRRAARLPRATGPRAPGDRNQHGEQVHGTSCGQMTFAFVLFGSQMRGTNVALGAPALSRRCRRKRRLLVVVANTLGHGAVFLRRCHFFQPQEGPSGHPGGGRPRLPPSPPPHSPQPWAGPGLAAGPFVRVRVAPLAVEALAPSECPRGPHWGPGLLRGSVPRAGTGTAEGLARG